MKTISFLTALQNFEGVHDETVFSGTTTVSNESTVSRAGINTFNTYILVLSNSKFTNIDDNRIQCVLICVTNFGADVLVNGVVADTSHDENSEPRLSGSETPATGLVSKQVVNFPPSVKVLPPVKSKKRGRPRKTTIKNKLDIAIGKMIKKKRKENGKIKNEEQNNLL